MAALLQLDKPKLDFIQAIAVEGLSVAKASKAVDIGVATGYRWMQEEAVAREIARIHTQNKAIIRGLATKRINKAFETLDNAMEDARVSPTQVTAAKVVLAYAHGPDAVEAAGNTINITIGTALDTNAAAAQAERDNARVARAIDTNFTIVDPNT